MIAPSGKQITIVAKDQQAVIVEVGGGLRSYSVGGRELLDGYGADEMSSSGRGQVLIPWPNRLEDGSYEFNGRRYPLPLNEAEHRNAIHGLVRWSTWTATKREPHRVVMEHILYPQPGYPFLLGITDLERDTDGFARVELHDSDRETKVSLWVDQTYPYLMLFSGDPLPNVRRRSLAVEPMTCPPNAFRTGDALIRLEPGASFTGTWGIAVEAQRPDRG
jgi:aldose 1-epimerase